MVRNVDSVEIPKLQIQIDVDLLLKYNSSATLIF